MSLSASWCDKGDAAGAWDGELVAVDRTTHRISTRFDVVPGRHNGGGIWGPGGVAIDPADGSIWTATANSVVETNGSLDEDAPFAERVLHLSTKLKVLASVVEPDSNEAVLGDQGFGSTPMLFQPTGCPALLAVNSKDSYTYVWRRSNLASAPLLRKRLGQRGATNDTFYAQPTWFPATRTLVVDGVALPDGSEASGAVGLHISSTCKFSVGWSLNIGGGVAPQPLCGRPGRIRTRDRSREGLRRQFGLRSHPQLVRHRRACLHRTDAGRRLGRGWICGRDGSCVRQQAPGRLSSTHDSHRGRVALERDHVE